MNKNICDHHGTEFTINQAHLWESPQQKLEDFALQKAQIQSIPGASPKQRDRYRVVVGNRILGDRLAIDEAWKLAGGAK